MTYKVEIHRDESGAWIARVPDVPGCHTYGRSLRQAKRRIREVLSLWVDDADRAELEIDLRLPADIRRAVAASGRARDTAAKARQSAQHAAATSARNLVRHHGFSVRDAADLLGLSHQRVQQLVSSKPLAAGANRRKVTRSAARERTKV